MLRHLIVSMMIVLPFYIFVQYLFRYSQQQFWIGLFGFCFAFLVSGFGPTRWLNKFIKKRFPSFDKWLDSF